MTPSDPHSLFFQSLQRPCPYRSLLCLNGHLPDKAFFERLPLPRVAADGAAVRLLEQGVNPDLIIGDLDSTPPELQQRYRCVKVSDQSTSDFQKALQHLKEHALFPTIVLGTNGGYLDHILCNLAIVAQQENCLLYDPPHTLGFVLGQGTHHFSSWPVMSKFSLIGVPEALVSSQGLKWELLDERLAIWDMRGFFHRTRSPKIQFEIKAGRLLVLLYLYPIYDAGSKG